MKAILAVAIWACSAAVVAASSSSLDDSRATIHTLHRRAVPKKLGAKCKSHTSCASGLYCNTSKKCAKKKAAGGTCKSNAACLHNVCYQSVCLGTNNFPVGAPCSSSTICASAYCTATTAGTCQARGAAGAACTANGGCLQNLCFNGQCLGDNNYPNGAPCSSSAVCASGYCTASTGGACQALGGIGAACTSGAGCASKSCNNSIKKCVVSDVQTLAPATQPVGAGASDYVASTGPFAAVGAGSMFTLGRVALGSDESKVYKDGQAYVTMGVDVVNPAMVREVLATPLKKRDELAERATPLGSTFSFEYKLDAFSPNGYCTLTPLINDATFSSDTISLSSSSYAMTMWRKKTYNLPANSNNINSIAIGVVCSTNAQATLLITSVTLKAVQPPPPPSPDPTFIWQVQEPKFDNSGSGSAWKLDGASVYQDDYPYADYGNAYMQPSATDGSTVIWQALGKDTNLNQPKYTDPAVNAQGGADQRYTLQFAYELKMVANAQSSSASLADRSCTLTPVVGGDSQSTNLPSLTWDASNSNDRPASIASQTSYTEAQASVYSLYQTSQSFTIPYDLRNNGNTRYAKLAIQFNCGPAMKTGFLRVDNMALLPAGTSYTIPEPTRSVQEPHSNNCRRSDQHDKRGC